MDKEALFKFLMQPYIMSWLLRKHSGDTVVLTNLPWRTSDEPDYNLYYEDEAVPEEVTVLSRVTMQDGWRVLSKAELATIFADMFILLWEAR